MTMKNDENKNPELNDDIKNPDVNDVQDNPVDDNKPEKTFTQKELDDIIVKRLARERKQWEKALEEERKRANMDELERVKLEKQEAEQKAAEAFLKANKRLVESEAKVQALALGIETKKLPYVLKLADLDVAELINEEGDIDSKGIKSAIKKIVEDLPELVTTKVDTSKGGSDFSKGNKGGMTREEFSKLPTREKTKLYFENPELYKKLRG